MIQRFEGHLTGADNNELFFQTWSQAAKRGVMVITHGLAEHSECYHPLARAMAEDGWQVFGWDLRGHGRSEGKRGFAMSINDYVRDFGCLLSVVRKDLGARNLILFGHSMGGLVTLRHLQTSTGDSKPPCAALALSSPALGLTVVVPKFKEVIAKVAMKWMPTLTLTNELKYTDLSHDENMVASYRRDNLRHDKISPGIFLSMVEGFSLAMSQAAKITMPVLMQLSGEDRVTSTPASHEFFAKLSDNNKRNQLIVYPESFHEVFNDRERDRAIDDLKKFVNPYLKESEGS